MLRVCNFSINETGTDEDAAAGTSEKEDKSGSTTPPEFKAETRQLLNIGINSFEAPARWAEHFRAFRSGQAVA